MNVRLEVSVVCPTYNSADFIETTLASIASQTELPLELIISDDGSRDNTLERVESFKKQHAEIEIRILRNVHRGPGATRNAGIRAAKGKWIAFLDSDDRWLPAKLSEVASVAKRHPEANFLCHNEELITLNGDRHLLDFAGMYTAEKPLGPQLVWRNIFTPSATVCTGEVLRGAGLFNEEMMSAQDYELWLRMSPKLRVRMIPKVLGFYIERRGSISAGYNWKYLKNCMRLLYWHRDKGGGALAFASIGRIALSYSAGRLRKALSWDGCRR